MGLYGLRFLTLSNEKSIYHKKSLAKKELANIMTPSMKHCFVCDKKPIVGRSIARRGLPKKTGGIGYKTTGITRRRFLPNLQKVKVRLPNGTVRRVSVCTSCLQAGKVLKATPNKLRHLAVSAAAA